MVIMRCIEILKLIKEAEESNIALVLELTDIHETTDLRVKFDRKVRENVEYILKRDCLWSDGLEVIVLPDVSCNPDGAFFGGFEVFNGDEMVARGKFNGSFVIWDEEVFTDPQIEGIEILDLTVSLFPEDVKKLFLLSVARLSAEEKVELLAGIL